MYLLGDRTREQINFSQTTVLLVHLFIRELLRFKVECQRNSQSSNSIKLTLIMVITYTLLFISFKTSSNYLSMHE